jgi:hypothetical protein
MILAGQHSWLGLQDSDPEGWWEESFNSHRDTKPKGPEAISMDVVFPKFEHVYGIPEHATSLALKPTTGARLPRQPRLGRLHLGQLHSGL